MNIYLDIETDWSRNITVVGFRSEQTGLVQLVGSDASRARLLSALPRSGRLFTYNGHSFDLTVIRKCLDVDLRDHFESIDLRWVCQRNGITGGQKKIEVQLGISRETEGVDGLEAIRLWDRYRRGDGEALTTLLRYNEEDIDGMVAIHRHLAGLKML
ncbi:MAG: ribonuclease H-like domain-containing protein [Verrucomicrobiota bacterium]